MILGIVQARLSSTRLPRKVLMPILGRPMLRRQLERLQRASRIDRLAVATSDQPEDQPLVEMCQDFGVECFCGSLDDVLDRFYRAARHYRADHVVRLTADCPVIDADLVNSVIDYYLSGDYDYASNVHPPTFPDGLDVEVMSFTCLEQAWRKAELRSQREHVTPFIWQQPDRFKLGNVTNDADLSNLRWTVDEVADFEFITGVYEALYPTDPTFSTAQILALLARHPELGELNSSFERNEGLKNSMAQDKARGPL